MGMRNYIKRLCSNAQRKYLRSLGKISPLARFACLVSPATFHRDGRSRFPPGLGGQFGTTYAIQGTRAYGK